MDSIFDDLTDHEIDEILKLTDECDLATGTEIFCQDSPGDALLIVKSGSASQIRISDSGDELDMGNCEKGMFLGELAILDRGNHPFTATALENMTVLKITREKLDLLFRINKRIICKFYLALIRYVNNKLRTANEKYASSRSSLRKI